MIDKVYLLGFSIDPNGRMQINSKLARNPKYSYSDLLDLVQPNGVEYDFADIRAEDTVDVSVAEITAAFAQSDLQSMRNRINLINKVIKSGAKRIFITDNIENEIDVINFVLFSEINPEEELRLLDHFLTDLNMHSTTELSDADTNAAIKNQVVNGILKVASSIENQRIAQIPVDAATDVFKAAAKKSTLANYEKTINSDNPLAMFSMQVQNMVGKEVIGITAVSLKQFFAKSAFYNKKIQEFVQNARNATPEQMKVLIQELVDQVVKRNPLTEEWTVFANLNFLDALEELPNIALDNIMFGNESTPYKTSKELLEWMQNTANKNDASMATSGILTLSTDFLTYW